MAVEVARLEARLSANTRDFDRAMDDSHGRFSKFGKAIGKSALVAGAAVGGGLALAAKVGFGEFLQGTKVAAQTNAVLKSTGGVANVTAKEVDNLATSLMRKSGVDDEQIKAGENWLLTFKNVRNEAGRNNDIFTQATKATLDLAVAQANAKGGAVNMGAASNMLGKALNDPIKGLTALNRVGVQFTADQKKQITALVESGKTMQAQKIILKELNDQVGGSAEAMGRTLGGQINIVRERFNNWAGDMVGRLIPSLLQFSNWITGTVLPVLAELYHRVKDDVRAGFNLVAGVIQNQLIPAFMATVSVVKTVLGFFNDHRTLTSDLAIVLGVAAGALIAYNVAVTVATALTKAWAAVQLILNAVMAANPVTLVVVALAALAAGLILAYKHSETFRRIVDGAFSAIKTAVDVSIGPITQIVKTVFGGLVAVVSTPINAVRAVITTVMALIHGDWDKAWEGLKTLAANTILALPRALLSIAGAILPRLLELGQALGSKIVEGLIAGVKALPGALARLLRLYIEGIKALAGLYFDTAMALGKALVEGIIEGIKQAPGVGQALVDKVLKGPSGIDLAKSALGIGSPSELTAKVIGRPLAEGIVKGILSGEISVSEALIGVVQKGVDRARSKVQNTFSTLSSWMSRAFSAKQGAVLTPTEILINKKQLEREKGDLIEAIQSAQTALNEAIVGGDPAAIAAAQKALDDAQYNQWLFDAQRRAEAERVDLVNRQFVEQEHFNQRLANLSAYLESGSATAEGGQKRILGFMKEFGIQSGQMGELLGRQFARGMRRMVPNVARAAEALRIAVKNHGILLRGRKITIDMEEKEDAPKGGPSLPGDYSPVTVSGVTSALADEIGLGQALGLYVSSGLRPGDPGDHGKGRAVDMSGSTSAMARFAQLLFGRPGTKDIIYGGLGVWQDNGRMISGWSGNEALRDDHYDHVHASVFDWGGVLRPGLNVLANLTGRNEHLVPAPGSGRGGNTYNLNINAPFDSRQDLARWFRELVRGAGRDGIIIDQLQPGF